MHPLIQEALDKAGPALKLAHGRITELEARVAELEAFLAGLIPRQELDQHRELRLEIETILNP